MPIQPLADRVRPGQVEDFAWPVGSDSNRRLLSELLNRGGAAAASSIILWGPPGCGKTTLARLIAKSRDAEFVELAAFSAGVAQVRDVLSAAKDRSTLFDRETVLFIDEFHRFSSSQQDSLLGAVEAGSILLIAATTEPPSVAVTRPLLSRSRVFELKTHDAESLSRILDRAVQTDFSLRGKAITREAMEAIFAISGGDARIALGIVEAAASQTDNISKSDVESANQTVPNYDKAGKQHYSIISAFIKSVRGSDPDAALQYLAMMIAGGEDPMFIARRLVILAAEDIGLADPTALQIATAAATATSLIGLPEARIPLAEATIYLCLAPKSNSAYLAINAALEQVNAAWPDVPEWLTNNSPDYRYPHDSDLGILEQDYGATQPLYKPKRFGLEAGLADRLAVIKRILRGDDSR